MKILHTVESYYPSLGGMQEVVRQLSERLVKFGHQVTVTARYHPNRKEMSLNGVQIEQFMISGNLGRGIQGDAGEIKRYQDFLVNSQFDIVTNFAAQEWACDLALPLLGKIKGKKFFVPTGFSGLYLPEYQNYFENMKNWMKKYDMNIFTSNDYRDINFARENNIENIIVIPNGADEGEFLRDLTVDIRKELQIPSDAFLIFHVGSHTGLKGHDEAIKIFERVPIKNAYFLLHGAFLDENRKPLNLFGKLVKFGKHNIKKILIFLHIHIIEKEKCPQKCEYAEKSFNDSRKRKSDGKRLFVRTLTHDEIISAYKQSDLFLFPSNVECSPLVLFECMAAKLPFLTSDAGNAREIIEWSHAGALLPTEQTRDGFCKVRIDESAQMLQKVIENKELWKTMGEAGFRVWQDQFTWEKISHDYEQLYSKLVSNGKTNVK